LKVHICKAGHFSGAVQQCWSDAFHYATSSLYRYQLESNPGHTGEISPPQPLIPVPQSGKSRLLMLPA